MKITKRQLKRIIKEEKMRLLREYTEADSPNVLVNFANAWGSLGRAVTEQVVSLVDTWTNEPMMFEDVAVEQNPEAIDMAVQRLRGPLEDLDNSEDAQDLLQCLHDAEEIYDRGDAEVEADRQAAERSYDPDSFIDPDRQ